MNYNDLKDQFLSKFPNDATAWGEATDEIREFTRCVRNIYNNSILLTPDDFSKCIEPLNFRSFATPAQWNSEAKKQINKIWPLLDDLQKKEALEYI